MLCQWNFRERNEDKLSEVDQEVGNGRLTVWIKLQNFNLQRCSSNIKWNQCYFQKTIFSHKKRMLQLLFEKEHPYVLTTLNTDPSLIWFLVYCQIITTYPDIRYDIGNANNYWIFWPWVRAHCANGKEG